MFVDMSGMKSLKETTVLISLRTSSLLTGCGSSIMALTLAGSGLMMVSKWTTRQFELKLGLLGIELHILFSCSWHHISQQATMLLLKRQWWSCRLRWLLHLACLACLHTLYILSSPAPQTQSRFEMANVRSRIGQKGYWGCISNSFFRSKALASKSPFGPGLWNISSLQGSLRWGSRNVPVW